MKKSLLALRMLRRDWFAGELRLLAFSLIVAVASVTSVSFFTDRISQALVLQAGELLGADLKIVSSRPLQPAILQLARKSALMQAESIEFPSMVIAGKAHQLAAIKAVSEKYPLRGAIVIASESTGPTHVALSMPRPGSVWLEPRLLENLHLNIGDELTLGNARLRVTATLVREPSRALGALSNIAPRLMLSMVDLPATGLVQPASRISYNVLFSGPPTKISTFRRAAEKIIDAGARIIGAEGARPEIRSALERGEKFLGLAALVSVMLSGIAIAMASRRFVARHLDGCAMMRCFGASQWDIVTIIFLELLFLAFFAGLVGCIIGYLAQLGLVGLLGSLLALDLPGPSAFPVVIGMLTGLITVVGFALPVLLHIRHVPALRVLRRELGALPGSSLSVYGTGIFAFGLLIIWQTADWALSFYMLAGMAGVLLILMGVAAGLIHLLRLLQNHIARPWRIGVRHLTRRTASSSIQIAAFGLGMTMLLLLSMVRADLLLAWEGTLPKDTPNRFLINIQAHQVSELSQYFTANDLDVPDIFPMVRGRLIEINGNEITTASYVDERARRLVAREFNLSWAEELQADNEIMSGAWWVKSDAGRKELSVEEGIAKTLEIQLGDLLSFDVAGSVFKAHVSSLRKVDWGSFRVNFFVIASPGMLDDYPVSYISSIYVPADKDIVFSQILQDFPNITVIDVAAIMNYVRQVIERVVLAVDYVFIFTLLSGLLVLYATIQATLDERIQENAIMRTLGAGRAQLVTALLIEFAGIGLLAGLVASWAASLLGVVLGKLVFDLPYTINYPMIALGTLAGGVGVCIAGYLGTRLVLTRPPLQSLMERA